MVVTFRIPRVSPRLLAILVAVLGVMLAAETVVLAATVMRNGAPVTAVLTKTSDEYAFTDSTTLSGVPGMTAAVTVPSGERALLVITFSAVSACYDVNSSGANTVYCRVDATVDGVTVPPGQVNFDTAGDGESFAWETNSMQFVAGPLDPGSHTVRIRYRVDESEGLFELSQRTLTVLRSRVG